MSKKYKIAVSDTCIVPVEGALKDENGKPRKFKFSLTCTRTDADEFKEKLKGDFDISDFLQSVTQGWKGQDLVLEDDDTPAQFCGDSFAALLNITGMAMVCFSAYGKETGATTKN